MSNKKEDSTIINKIEIDEKSGEPTIVEVNAEDIVIESKPKKQNTSKKKTEQKSKGKQLVMHGILGFSKEDEFVDKRQKLFKNIFAIVFIVLMVVVLAITAYQDFFSNPQGAPNWSDIWSALSNSWIYAIPLLLSVVLSYFFKAFKLSLMCKSMTKKWHFKTCFETAIIGHYYNSVTPLAVGGQPFEIYHLSKHGVHGGVATSLPICAYFLHQIVFVILGLVSLLLFKDNVLMVEDQFYFLPPVITAATVIGIILGAIVPILVIVFSLMPRFCSVLVHFVISIGGKLKLIKNPKATTYKTLKTVVHNCKCIKKLATKPLVFISSTIISLCEHLAICSIAYFCLKLFGFNWQSEGILEWLQVVHICMIIYLAISFIPTPGNSGAADFSFFYLFQAGITAGLAFPAMLLWRGLSYYLYIIVGFIFTTAKSHSDKLHPYEEPVENANGK